MQFALTNLRASCIISASRHEHPPSLSPPLHPLLSAVVLSSDCCHCTAMVCMAHAYHSVSLHCAHRKHKRVLRRHSRWHPASRRRQLLPGLSLLLPHTPALHSLLHPTASRLHLRDVHSWPAWLMPTPYSMFFDHCDHCRYKRVPRKHRQSPPAFEAAAAQARAACNAAAGATALHTLCCDSFCPSFTALIVIIAGTKERCRGTSSGTPHRSGSSTGASRLQCCSRRSRCERGSVAACT